MNAASTVLLAVSLSAVAGGLAGGLLASGPDPRAADAAVVGTDPVLEELRGLRAELEAQRRAVGELERRLDERGAVEPTRPPVAALRALVREVVEQEASALASAERAAGDGSPAARFDARAAVDELLAMEASGPYSAVEERWAELREAGRIDAVLEELERRAELDPENPAVHVDLGAAYIQKLLDVPPGPLQGKWGTLADRAFDRALELDDHDWEARFQKAVSLSFWPPIFGKQGEAVHHFEVLLEQQSGVAPEPHFADTYVLLGNLYQQTGDADRALATWREGQARFPDHAALTDKLALAGGE